MQSIVTSSAQNDSALFETDLRDERYLPFENSGTISEWQLELPTDVRQFDYDTISDVIVHIRYTACEGGGLLRNGALANLKARIEETQAAGSVRLFWLRHGFPTEWAKFQSETPGANQRFELALTLRDEHYPFWSQGRLTSVKRVDILALSTGPSLEIFDKADQNDPTVKKDTFAKDGTFGNLLAGKLTNVALPAKTEGEFKVLYLTGSTPYLIVW